MDLTQFLIPQNQNTPSKTQQSSNTLPGSSASEDWPEKEGLSAFDHILSSVTEAEKTQADTPDEDNFSTHDNSVYRESDRSAHSNAPLSEAEEISLLLGGTTHDATVDGQNLPPAVLESLPPELSASLTQAKTPEAFNAALESYLQANPQRIGDVLATVQSGGVDISGIDIGAILNGIEPSALSSDVTPNLVAPSLQAAGLTETTTISQDVALSAQLGILDTVTAEQPRGQEQPAQSQTAQTTLTLSDAQIRNIAALVENTNGSAIPQVPDLSTTGLTIEQLAALPPVEESASDTLERVSLVDQFVSLIVPQDDGEDGLSVAQTLNNLVVGAGDAPDQGALQPLTPVTPPDEPSNFELLLRQLIGLEGGNDNQLNSTQQRGDSLFLQGVRDGAASSSARGADALRDGPALRQNLTPQTGATTAGAGNDVLVPADISGLSTGAEFADSLSIAALSGSSTLLSPGQSALLAQANSASSANPATQMVAASMQKGAQLGQNTQITLHLDPAELGRVEVKLMFDSENIMRAVVTTEKPETHLMMQRDSSALAKSLQDAGVTMDSDGGLSFELAQDGSYFENQGQGGGGHNGSGHGGGNLGNGDNEYGDVETLETTMTWDYDPDTGHTHYSILA